MRLTVGDRVTVTDPSHWHYGAKGVVIELGFDAMSRRVYITELADERLGAFTVEQLDFTEEEAPTA
jgi:hypothetical protein